MGNERREITGQHQKQVNAEICGSMPAKGRRFDSIHVNRTHNQRILFGRIERRTQARRAGELTTTMRSSGARSDVQTFQVFFSKNSGDCGS